MYMVKNEVYPFSVFYIPYGTFEKAGKRFSLGENLYRISKKMNVR